MTDNKKIPDIPALSEDAWDLVQYRLWDKIRGKMWATLTVFLTLTSFAGLLGIPAYISGKIDDEIKKKSQQFERLKVDLETERLGILTLSATTSHLAFLWEKNLAALQKARFDLFSKANAEMFNNDRSAFRAFILFLERLDLKESEDQFRYDIRVLTAMLNCGCLPEQNNFSNDPLTETDWSAFEGAASKRGLSPELPQLYGTYSHVIALRAAMGKSHQIIIDQTLKDSSRRAALYEQFNSAIYPSYRQSLNELYGTFPPPVSRRESNPWRWLSETAVSEFLNEELRLNQSSKDDAN